MIGPYYITTDQRRRAAYGDPCGEVARRGRVIIDGRTLACRTEAVIPFSAWEQIRASHGYRLTGNDTGIYACRHMQHNSSMPYSYHSWGMAMDVNWLENPAGNKLVTDIPKAMRDDILAIRTISGARVFRWGGDWDWDGISSDHTYIDAMHWEVVAHPLDLATGLKGITITPPNEEEQIMQRGDKGKAVAEVQHAGKKFWGWDNGTWTPHAGNSAYDGKAFGPGEDGSFGASTEANVKAFQQSMGLPETGIVDGVVHSMLFARYGSGGGGLTAAQVDSKISAHAANPDAHHE